MGNPPTSVPTQDDFRRVAEFVDRYANNVQIQSTQTDLKMVFGMTDQVQGSVPARFIVDQHTGITMTWVQVKLVIYFLQLHLAGHEMENGKVKIPSRMLPPEPPEIPLPPFDNEQGRQAFDLIRRMRADFIRRLAET